MSTFATSTPASCTDRDWRILAALARCPLTADQILKLSATFPHPFPSLRKVRWRMRALSRQRKLVPPLVRTWRYATAGPASPNYYTLSRIGGLLLGDGRCTLPASAFNSVAIARQRHTRGLSDFIVHTLTTAHWANVQVANWYRENDLRLEVGSQCLFPDAAFDLVTADGATFSFFTELDNGTEPVFSTKERDSWDRKLRLYAAYQSATDKRFRVLIVSTNQPQRIANILTLARRLTDDSPRSLFYGIRLTEYLALDNAITTASFMDNRGQAVSLVPQYRKERIRPPQIVPAELAAVGGP